MSERCGLTSLRLATSTSLKESTNRQKNLLHRGSIKFETAALRDNIRIVSSQFRDAVLGGKGRYRSGPTNLLAAGDGNHDGCLLLALLWRLDGEAFSASDDGEDVQEVDREHRIEKHLTITLRHA